MTGDACKGTMQAGTDVMPIDGDPERTLRNSGRLRTTAKCASRSCDVHCRFSMETGIHCLLAQVEEEFHRANVYYERTGLGGIGSTLPCIKARIKLWMKA